MKNQPIILLQLLLVLCLACVHTRCWAVKNEDILRLNEKERQTLLRLARDTVTGYLEKGSLPDMHSYYLSPTLQKNLGVFVTLKEKGTGALRGCIGYIIGRKPLAESVVDCSVFAATRDRRFSPLKRGEQDTVHIEISVLSPPRLITSIDEILLGTHGLIITKGPYSGVLLPQVAVEQGWNRNAFLEAVCRKAGLPAEAWREKGTMLSVFKAQVFSEPSAHNSADTEKARKENLSRR